MINRSSNSSSAHFWEEQGMDFTSVGQLLLWEGSSLCTDDASAGVELSSSPFTAAVLCSQHWRTIDAICVNMPWGPPDGISASSTRSRNSGGALPVSQACTFVNEAVGVW
eukprot:CAMPEP_0176448272 /NCGR_PEP_ID=MMETSP0127-20121128/25659_1 /TAXON_ID=938130 /ORGANISM="Platyophrya macrostoma, Strain WH" /LENGTH=109 /DNA_ID=CAMNT_0017835139 /DNA_START=84 /DNA_END=410 /DNA_ORIENTATION=+